MSFHAANSYVGLAQMQLYQGKVDEAVESLKESLHLAQEINAPDVIAEAYCVQTEINLAQNELAEACQSAQTAASLAVQIGVTTLVAIAWRLTSASLLRQGNCSEARAALDKAWQALEDGSEKIEDGRLHAQEVLLSLALNDPKTARDHRAAAENVFKELGAARDLVLLPVVEGSGE